MVINSIRKNTFKDILSLLLPSCIERRTYNKEQLLEVLDVALEIALEYNIVDWLLPAFTELGLRDEPLAAKEASRIGWECTTAIADLLRSTEAMKLQQTNTRPSN